MSSDTPELSVIELQEQLEEKSRGLTVKRYNDKRRGTDGKPPRKETEMPPGVRILLRTIRPVADEIAARLEVEHTGARRGPKSVPYRVLKLHGIEPEVAAFFTAKRCINAIVLRETHTYVSKQVGIMVKDEIEYRNFERGAPGLFHYIENKNRSTGSDKVKRIRRMRAAKYAGIAPASLTDRDLVILGAWLIDIFKRTTNLIDYGKYRKGKRTTKIIVGHPKALEVLEAEHARCEYMAPVYLPMVMEPKRWNRIWGNPYYYSRKRMPVIKAEYNMPYLEELRSFEGQMQPVFDALNTVQETPWEVNTALYHIMREAWDNGLTLGNLPSREMDELPAKPYDIATNEEARQVWKRQAAAVYEERARKVSKRVAMVQKLYVAEEFMDKVFYFPMQLDWRGRLYPLTTALNPQEDDSARALLRFHRGIKLGESGAFWLAVHGANLFGYDKVTLEDRVAWVRMNEDSILECALDPFGARNLFWTEADKPWQFLAFCFEWAGYKVEGKDYVSHLPIALDGSCNGIQHLTALMRDEKGAVSVNLAANGKPHDIYGEVAKVVDGQVDKAQWPGRVDRALMKRNVMTLPYGVKRYGMREQLLEHLSKEREKGRSYFDRTDHDEWRACHYLSGLVDRSIRDIVGKACECMDWLVKVARVASTLNLPVQWTAPSGMLVQQRYLRSLYKRIDTNIGEFRLQSRLALLTNRVDSRKQANGISPNFIHSLDAAHLVATVNLARNNDTYTVDSFAMIHDSFGCHAGDVEAMMSSLRESFIEMYSEDLLTKFRDEILEQLPEKLRADIPPVPALGRLDIEGVRDSDFFFS